MLVEIKKGFFRELSRANSTNVEAARDEQASTPKKWANRDFYLKNVANMTKLTNMTNMDFAGGCCAEEAATRGTN